MYPAGATVSQCWTNNVEGVKCNTQTSTGSFQNVQDVASGEVDVAVATADVVLNGYNGTGKFADVRKLDNICVIGAVYTSVLCGVSLKSSGLKNVNELKVVLECTRRTVGYIMPILALIFVAYALAGPNLPYAIAHRGYSIQRICKFLATDLDGLFGTTMSVSASVIFMFVMFVSFLRSWAPAHS